MKTIGLSCVLAVCLLAAPTSLSAGEIPAIQAKIFVDSKADWLALRDLSLDQVWSEDGYIEIITDQAELDRIAALGIRTEIVHPNLTRYLQSRLPVRGMGAYKTLDEIYAYLDNIIASYPAIVSPKISIGQTIEGRDMWAVKISDNPGTDEDEPEVLYTACVHAREVITPEVLFYFMDHLTQNYGTDPTITDLVDNRELWFVVMCNPDGYYHNEVIEPYGGGLWRKNRRDNGDGEFGVDLNRNWGYMWGVDDGGSSPDTYATTYRGTGPFSEPETMNLKLFTEAHDFVIAMYYHSYSNLILWAWGYDEIYTADEDIFAALGDSVNALNGYTPGPGWILYLTNGTSDDWYYGEQTTKNKIYGFTMEVGSYNDNFWPAAERIDDLVTENLAPNLFVADIADRVEKLAQPETPVLSVEDTVDAAEYAVSWTHIDSENPAVEFELSEYWDYQSIADSAFNLDHWQNHEFTLTAIRQVSPPYSFYSGSGDDLFRYIVFDVPHTVGEGDTLRFQAWYDIERDWDYAYVDISTDGINFTPIAGNLTTDTDPNGSNRGHGITGSSGGWVEGLFDLADYVGQEIYVRFLYKTDGAVIEEGIYFDDISPVGVYSGQDTYLVGMADSSYTFSDKLEDTYYYRLRARDAENQWSEYSASVQTVVVRSYICGDANGDEAINVGDAVYVINYVFKGGNQPDPMEAGDANADGAVNVGDAVYLINYVFKSGPVPLCP